LPLKVVMLLRRSAACLVCSWVCAASAQQFLTRALMPLHKPKCVAMYHQQLAYCVTQVRQLPGEQQSGTGGSSSSST